LTKLTGHFVQLRCKRTKQHCSTQSAVMGSGRAFGREMGFCKYACIDEKCAWHISQRFRWQMPGVTRHPLPPPCLPHLPGTPSKSNRSVSPKVLLLVSWVLGWHIPHLLITSPCIFLILQPVPIYIALGSIRAYICYRCGHRRNTWFQASLHGGWIYFLALVEETAWKSRPRRRREGVCTSSPW
jgi:hypothetical protein